MGRVIVPQRLHYGEFHNLSEFGTIKYLASEREILPSLWDNHLVTLLESRIKETNFDPKNDYIAATGRQALCQIVFSLLARQHERVPCLLYDRGLGRYVRSLV